MRRFLIVLATLIGFASPALAANSTVSAMTAASALGGTELLYCVQGGADRKCTPAQISTYLAATYLPLTGGTINGQFSDGCTTGCTQPNPFPDGNSWVSFQAPNTKAFGMDWFDNAGNQIRTFDQSTGRIDAYSNSAAGASSGPTVVLNYNNAAPANNDVGGHFAVRNRDSNGNYNTVSYWVSTLETVSATALNSSTQMCGMQNVNAGAGNAQPNVCATLDGQGAVFTIPSGFQFSATGNSVPFSASNTSGPEIVLTNTTNSRVARFGVADNFNTIINSTGGGGVQLQVAGTVALSVGGSGATRIIAETRTAKTTNYTVLSTDGGTQFDNTGAAGEVDFTLPAAPTLGTKFGFMVFAAQTVKIIAPASTTINVGGTVSAAAGNAAATQVGAYIELEYVGSNKYVAKSVTGTGGSTGAGGWTVT